MKLVATMLISQSIQLTLFLIAMTGSSVECQSVNIVKKTGRNFPCVSDSVTYICTGQGNSSLTIEAPPYITDTFFGGDSVPNARTRPNAVLTLTRGMPNFEARLQINITEAANITCTVDGNTKEVRLALSEIPIPPSNVELEGLTGNTKKRSVKVSWIRPVNLTFDIEHFIVNTMVGGVVANTVVVDGNSEDVEVEIPFNALEELAASVSTVTPCGDMSVPRMSPTVPAIYPDFYAAFLVPLAIVVILFVVIIILSIVVCRQQMKITRYQQVRDIADPKKAQEHRELSEKSHV